ncbi:MAG: ribosome recycling factor [Candidatus Omnitrophica bacterium]|nr:ribosome recycling factor [Candidatus Omnitrophota bacterium]
MHDTELGRILKETRSRMDTTVEAVQKQFSTIRTGRAHPRLVEAIRVDYYGTKTPLKQLANITTPEPRLIVIQPWDKNSMDMIEKAIMSSDVGITPVNDGKVIRLSMPQLTHERREELAKVLHKIAEEGKISIRNSRHQAIDEAVKLEKQNKMTEDDKFDTKDKVQKLTDEYIKKIDTALKEKESEIKG